MLQLFISTLRYNYDKHLKSRKIRCFENTMEFGFSVAHLAHQKIFGSFLAEKK